MKSALHTLILCLFCSACLPGLQAQVYYTTERLSANRWAYHSVVENVALTAGIEEFTIWFGYGQYEQLQIASENDLATHWDQIVWQPNPALLNNGGFDGMTLTVPIATGRSVPGFAVSYNWLSQGEPGKQFYEIINPDTFEVLDSGFTVFVPEPFSGLLFGLGGLFMFRRTWREYGRKAKTQRN